MSHDEVYGRADLYDIAFDFRDVAAECDALLAISRRWAGAEPGSFLEVAAGPAAHAREMARRGLRAVAVDLSHEMVAFGVRLAAREGVRIEYREADMTAFSLDRPVELAAMLMSSESYLLDNDAVLAHLDCVADALQPGGIYVIEMSHPRDAFRVGRSAENDWVASRDGTTVHVTWGRDDDDFDPLTQITQVTVIVAWRGPEGEGALTEVAPERTFVANELRALVRASGRFEVVTELGAVDATVRADDDERAWRYVPVLRRLDSE